MDVYTENTIARVRAKLADVGQHREAAPTFTWKEIEYLVTAIEDYKHKIALQMTEISQLRYRAQKRSS